MIQRLKNNNIEFTEFKNGIVINADCLDVVDLLEFDHVLTDPPYGYLNHKIETFFDYKKLFLDIKSRINDKGAFLIFGRGDLFYEWNLCLKDLGFIYKEDCVLIKNKSSNQLNVLQRYAENFSIRGLRGFSLNKVLIPITDKENIKDSQIADWFRKCFHDKKYKQLVIGAIQSGCKITDIMHKNTTNHPVQTGKLPHKILYSVSFAFNLLFGKQLSNVIYGTVEKEYQKQHPTIKPSKSINYLVEAISNENQVILDPFLGLGTTSISCINTRRRFIGIEIDKEYYKIACDRIDKRETEYLPLKYHMEKPYK